MLQRTSYVTDLKVTTVSYSSVIQLGDSEIINGFSRAIAVQREEEVFYSDEGSFSAYPVFNKPIPFMPIREQLVQQTSHIFPVLKVKKIDILGISASSILHIGNSQNISLESRIKHIRQLRPR
ncbi:spore germination protein GerPE [Bacillus canaveralius]|uniref:Spore germination protein GerPE n=1 Tax=Bacillus canaveralius TaxID=1403243 RepID=A0A2N5GKC6_9BACI|nr:MULTISPECIES: spore germination protein GerPE [Bacillus]PLR81964.1 spore germination protein GerPE [Bacillus canaveralius]PLR87368.1 spore germination protein GerPE [Bacillus sp. V33-4]PLR99350.1 spore germination protein GerPE [Bacillus canaveralius]RSK46929.1 spore germination protein GerPE [Bacillus canaveralius]